MDGQTDGHMDVQREAIIPRHCCVAGYKNYKRPALNLLCAIQKETGNIHKLYCYFYFILDRKSIRCYGCFFFQKIVINLMK